jgi:Ser/Thr protein kinase RdoA (MazF antagonist)
VSKRNDYPTRIPLDVDGLISEMGERYGRDFSPTAEPLYGYRSIILFLADELHPFVLKIASSNLWQPIALETVLTLSSLKIPAPKPVAMVDGEIVWSRENAMLVLYEREQGAEPSAGDLVALRLAGQKLGDIHQTPLNLFNLPNTPFGAIVERTRRNALQRGLSSDLPPLPVASDFGQQNLLHGDYRGQNVLFTDGTISCVLDWDDAVLGPKLFDLAYSALFFQAVIKDEPPSEAEITAFLAGYHDTFPLTAEDRALFPDYLATALHQGLVLWMSIRDEVNDPAICSRASEWISGYAPLASDLNKFAAF